MPKDTKKDTAKTKIDWYAPGASTFFSDRLIGSILNRNNSDNSNNSKNSKNTASMSPENTMYQKRTFMNIRESVKSGILPHDNVDGQESDTDTLWSAVPAAMHYVLNDTRVNFACNKLMTTGRLIIFKYISSIKLSRGLSHFSDIAHGVNISQNKNDNHYSHSDGFLYIIDNIYDHVFNTLSGYADNTLELKHIPQSYIRLISAAVVSEFNFQCVMYYLYHYNIVRQSTKNKYALPNYLYDFLDSRYPQKFDSETMERLARKFKKTKYVQDIYTSQDQSNPEHSPLIKFIVDSAYAEYDGFMNYDALVSSDWLSKYCTYSTDTTPFLRRSEFTAIELPDSFHSRCLEIMVHGQYRELNSKYRIDFDKLKYNMEHCGIEKMPGMSPVPAILEKWSDIRESVFKLRHVIEYILMEYFLHNSKIVDILLDPNNELNSTYVDTYVRENFRTSVDSGDAPTANRPTAKRRRRKKRTPEEEKTATIQSATAQDFSDAEIKSNQKNEFVYRDNFEKYIRLEIKNALQRVHTALYEYVESSLYRRE